MTEHTFKLFGAVYLFLIKDNQILLLRRQNTNYYDGSYSVVAGHLDGNEHATTAMLREAKEEAGITLEVKDLTMAHVMHRLGPREYVDFYFTTEKWQGEVTNLEPQKCDELTWFALDALPENIIPEVRQAIEHWQKGAVFSEFQA